MANIPVSADAWSAQSVRPWAKMYQTWTWWLAWVNTKFVYFIGKLCVTGVADCAWKAKQISGRAGRDGRQAVSISLVYPQPGKNGKPFKEWKIGQVDMA